MLFVTDRSPAMFDKEGPVDEHDCKILLDKYKNASDALITAATRRASSNLVDTTARTGYGIIGSKPENAREMAMEYFHFDWEYAQTPEVVFSFPCYLERYSPVGYSNPHGSLRLGSVALMLVLFYRGPLIAGLEQQIYF